MNKKTIYRVFMLILAIVIILNFGIHVYRTNEFNRQVHTIDSYNEDDTYNFSFIPQNGKDISWTRTATINDEVIDLYACSYEGAFVNKSTVEVAEWTMRIDINSDCFLNSAWCGRVEIHQRDGDKENVQTLDLRNIKEDEVRLKHYVDGDIHLFPLSKGDYLIYYPDLGAKEYPIVANGNTDGRILIGVIFYWNQTKEFNKPSYHVEYRKEKGYFQGTEATIFIVMSFLWILLFVAGLSATITARIMRQQEIMALTQKNNEYLNEEVKKRISQITDMQHKVVLGMADMIENRDSNTGGHVKRTSDVVKILVDEIRKQGIADIDDVQAIDIERAAPMHDLGKLSIDNSILSKPARLTDEEFEIMKTHSTKSGEFVHIVLDGIEEEHFVNTAYNVARFHHERWDGRGYPDGLSGDDIPFEARVMAIADVYDALVSKRCYKEAMSFEKAYDIMSENMGSQFDPKLQPVFNACRDKLEMYYSQNN